LEDNITYRKSTAQDILRISNQIAVSYKSAYKGLMSDDYLLSLSDDYWVPILQNAASAGNTCLVAENKDRIIGSVVFGKSTMESHVDDTELFAIYLLPDYIRCGVGHKLYTEAEKVMIMQKLPGCVLEVLSENTRAIDFYTSHGFKEIKAFTVEENGMVLRCKTMYKRLMRPLHHQIE